MSNSKNPLLRTINFFNSELRMKVKGIIGWSAIWMALGTLLLSLFDSLQAEQDNYTKILSSLPESLSRSFNIATNYLSSLEVYLSGQFLTFYTLIGTIFACFLGVSLIAGKVEDRTIFQRITTGFSRNTVYGVSVFVGAIFLFLSSFLIGGYLFILGNLVTKQENISLAYFSNLSFGTLILNIFFLYFANLIGLLFGRSRGISIAGGLAGVTWFLNTLSKIKGFPEWMQYLSPFYYFNIPELTKNFSLDYSRIWVLGLSAIFFLIIGLWRFRTMDLYL